MSRVNPTEQEKKILKLQGLIVTATFAPLFEADEDGARPNMRTVAGVLGIAPSTLSNLQNGERLAGRRVVCLVARYLNDKQVRLWLRLFEYYEDKSPADGWEVTLVQKIQHHWPEKYLNIEALHDAIAPVEGA